MPFQAAELHTTLSRTIADFSAVWPEEPIGVGALWEVTTTINRAWANVTLVRVFQLTAAEGETCSLHVAAIVRGDHQSFVPVNPPLLTEYELLSLTGSASATIEGHLDGFAVPFGRTEQSYESHVRVRTFRPGRGWATALSDRTWSSVSTITKVSDAKVSDAQDKGPP
jgi:hypothetical protein